MHSLALPLSPQDSQRSSWLEVQPPLPAHMPSHCSLDLGGSIVQHQELLACPVAPEGSLHPGGCPGHLQEPAHLHIQLQQVDV